jgi:tRNA-splicing ligase RtcB
LRCLSIRPAPGSPDPFRSESAHHAVAATRDWITSGGGTSYDSIIGSVGGGNHFAELQYVSAVHDGAAAYAWGLAPGRVVLMVHGGSLSLGHQVNATGLDQSRNCNRS